MLRQLMTGGVASASCIAVHALVMALVVRAANAASIRYFTAQPSARLAVIMVATVLTLMIAHTCEIAIWAFVYLLVGAAPAGADTLYFAFVNYTTLGYGDVVPTESWRLLGPMTAMNGVLLFGWSTAVIFEVLQAARVAKGRRSTQRR